MVIEESVAAKFLGGLKPLSSPQLPSAPLYSTPMSPASLDTHLSEMHAFVLQLYVQLFSVDVGIESVLKLLSEIPP